MKELTIEALVEACNTKAVFHEISNALGAGNARDRRMLTEFLSGLVDGAPPASPPVNAACAAATATRIAPVVTVKPNGCPRCGGDLQQEEMPGAILAHVACMSGCGYMSAVMAHADDSQPPAARIPADKIKEMAQPATAPEVLTDQQHADRIRDAIAGAHAAGLMVRAWESDFGIVDLKTGEPVASLNIRIYRNL